jgi:hypothetical protein
MKDTGQKVLSIAAVLAGIGYAIWAQMSTPAKFPADVLIGLQAFWNDGRYAVKLTAIESLLTLLAYAGLIALPVALIARLIALGRRDPTKPTELPGLLPGWSVLHQRPRGISLGGAVVGLGVGLVHLATFALAPERFAPLGGPGGLLGMVILMLGPVAAMLGTYFAVEVIMGTVVLEGTVDQLTIQAHGKQVSRYVWVGDKKFAVPTAVYGRLERGQRCAICYAGGTRRLLELRVATR